MNQFIEGNIALWGYREIVLEHDVQKTVDDYTGKIARFRDAFDALEWLLSRKPEIGRNKLVGEVRWSVYVQGADAMASTPEIWVLYKFDDAQVHIHGINVIE